MTLRLPSPSIKQVIQNVILHAEKHLLYVVRNIMFILYGFVVLFIFTGYDLTSYGGEERCIRVLVMKPDGKRPLGRPRCRWEDNNKVDLQKVCGGMD